MALKTYYSTTNICNIHVMRSPGFCETMQFLGGKLTTEDNAVQAYLDPICDKSGSGIFSSSPRGDDADVLTARHDVRIAAEAAHAKMLAAGQST